jgi:hypothetical protein
LSPRPTSTSTPGPSVPVQNHALLGDCRHTFTNTIFGGADLRSSSLGGRSEAGRENTFRSVDFTRTDLRGAAFGTGDMTGCAFCDAKLKRVNFGGARFKDCTFSDLLDEVIFNRLDFLYKDALPNEMKNVSFADARFRFVEFRKLDMADVVWPTASGHLVVDDYRATLECAIARLTAVGSEVAKRAAGLLAHYLKWAGDQQMTSVITAQELSEPGQWDLVLKALAECSGI